MTNSERHRLSLIIATLGPSTDNEKELITMLMAGIARQWTDGVDIARVLYSDGNDVAKSRIDIFKPCIISDLRSSLKGIFKKYSD